MKPIHVTGLAVLLASTCAIWALRERSLRMELEHRASSGPVTAGDVRRTTTPVPKPATKPTSPVAPVTASSPESKPAKAAKQAADANPMKGMADMMKDPAMREAMRRQARAGIGMMYREVFDLLGLDAEKSAAVERILANRQDALMESSLSLMGGGKPDDATTAAMNAATETAKAELKALLGEQDYARFEKFEDSQNERMQISTLSKMLQDKGVAFPEETESALMDAMYEERKNFKFDQDFSSQTKPNFSAMTPENLDKFSAQSDELRERILARANTILTPEQLPAFKEAQQSQAAMERMGMEMAKRMFANPDTK